MKYKDLVQFDPIESIVKLKDADLKVEAERLVKTYVMSQHMADSLIDIVLPQLQFDQTIDNKGVFIVGNYGTGKSHLMSVVSSIAEDENLLELVKNVEFKEAAKTIAGKFEVLRFEIGASKMALRDIVLSNIEKDLKSREITYKFPKAEEVTDNKQSLIEMMGIFEEKYPDKGYLIVVDELLDYLGSRKELELKYDLSFLREMGEISKHCRIRFIAGVQETLFDNPNFSFVAKTMLKVKDRFEQILIHREDISFVVSQRLLQKTDEQKAWIREHLQKFSFLYKNMADRLEEYVNLYPIHPQYLVVFEKVYLAEKREVLKTITTTIRNIIEKEVPENEPGIISYDTYWNFVKESPSKRTVPDVKEVIDKSSILEGIIEHSYTRPQYKPMALRIIYALSVHRLTTGEVHAPIGITIENMKDDLCLFDPMIPEVEEDFLISQITTVMKEIFNTVSGQFIEYNKENEQYYLNLKKDVDFNAKIQQKAEVIDDISLNAYYHNLVLKAMEFDRTPYKPDFKIWEYELIWESRNIEREGYLFLGGPNERPTAQPPRDFYLYFIPPYGEPNSDDSRANDEVFILFDGSNDEVKENIKMYAAALSMADIASKESKPAYLKKAGEYQKEVVNWIRKNANQCFTIKYKGEAKTLPMLLTGKRLSDKSLKDQIDMAASESLNVYFNEKYKDYPKFKLTVTRTNQLELFKSALNYLAGKKTEQGAKILDSFELFDNENIKPEKSLYAKYYIDMINSLGQGKVINKSDIIEEINEIEVDKRFKLGIHWVLIILASLVYSGDITLTVPGKRFDATMLKELAAENTSNLIDFKHFEKPKDIPLDVLKKLFEFLEIPQGMIVNSQKREEAVTKMLVEAEKMIERTIKAQQQLIGDTTIWGKDTLESFKKDSYKKELKELKEFLDSIGRFNTVAKLKNIGFTIEEIEKHQKSKAIIKELSKIKELKEAVDSNVQYLSNTEIVMDDEYWKNKLTETRKNLNLALTDLESIDTDFIRKFNIKLQELKSEYIELYLDLHKKHRLSLNEDNRKKELMKSKKLDNLKKLRAVEGILPINRLDKVLTRLGSLITCYNLTKLDLETSFVCPHCHFKPNEKGDPVHGVIDQVETQIDSLEDDFTEIILGSIEDPMIKDNISYLKPDQQKQINDFLETRSLPEVVDNNFVLAVNTLLMGLEKIEVELESLRQAITGDGPVTVDDMYKKFKKYMDTIIQGKDESKVRIILK
ncbi:MAG: DUF6079 family protein [Bacillota bacterium]